LLRTSSSVFTSGSAAGYIWRIGGVSGAGALDDHGIAFAVHFNPAFLSTAWNVPVASVVPVVAGNSDDSRIVRVLVLPMAAFGTVVLPAVSFQQSD
jgi:hypothetical protein